MATNTKKLHAELTRFSREMEIAVRDHLPIMVGRFQRKVALDALAKVVKKTPVRTGRARGNWQMSVDSPIETQVEVSPGEYGKGVSQADAARKTAAREGGKVGKNMPPFSTIWISNNVPYIAYLENGTSKQKPHGMVLETVREIRQELERSRIGSDPELYEGFGADSWRPD